MKTLSIFGLTIILITIMVLGGMMSPSGTARADSTNYESFIAGSAESTLTYAFGGDILSQSFIAGSNHNINAVSLKLAKENWGGTGTVYASIRATEKKTFTVDEVDYELDIPRGEDLAVGSISDSGISATPGWHQINFNRTIQLTQNKAYAIVLSAPAGVNPIAWRAAVGYPQGNPASGASWSDTWSSADPFYDFLFQVIGDPLKTGDVPTATGTGTIEIVPSAGSLDQSSIQTLALEDLSQDAQDSAPSLGVQFTHGFFKFAITGLTPGDSVEVTITLPQTISGMVTYYKYTDHWFTVPCWKINDTTIRIRLTDGGTGDDDGIADGTINDDGGPAEPPVVAGFSATPLSGLSPLEVHFTDESTGNVTSWEWDFDNNGSVDSTDQNPVYSYDFTTTSNSQTFSPKLTVIVTGNGTDSTVRDNYITIYRPPSADFTATPTAGFPPLTVSFTRQTSGYINDVLWDFGDGDTSTGWNPAPHTYAVAGNYTVSLTANNSFGSDTETKVDYIEVYGRPQADFNAIPLSGPAPLTVQFTDLSLGGATTWQWDFDNDGSIDSTDQDPQYTYTTPGIYSVSLTVEGGDIETKTNYITVNPPTITHLYEHWNDSDVVDTTQYMTTTIQELGQTFTASEDHTVTSIRLKLYRNGTPGTITVHLRNSLGGDDIAAGTIDGNTITTSSAGAWYEFTLSPVVNLNAGSPYAIVISSGNNVGWRCDTDTNLDYSGGVAYYNYYGWSSIAFRDFKFEVYGAQFIDADFSATPTSGPAPLTVHFTDETTGSTPSFWLWDFGDGDTSTEQNPTHIYTTPGTYTVSLTVDGVNTETRTDYITVDVNIPPVADAGGPYSENEGTAVVFDAGGSYDPDGVVAAYEWDWETDGVFDFSSNSSSASYTWYDDFTGNVTLRVTDGYGLSSTGTAEVTVTNVAPSVDAGSDQSVDTLAQVSFTGGFNDPGTLDTHSVDWNFGDGGTSSGSLTANHAYAASGTYTVTLTVVDDDGGTGTDTCTITVTDSSGGSPGGGGFVPVIPFAEDVDTGDEQVQETPAPADFKLGNIIINADSVYEGDTVIINVELSNNGSSSGSFPLELQIDGVTVETRAIDLGPGETRTVSFNVVVRLTGTHLISIGDMFTTLEVLAVKQAAPAVSSFYVSDLSISPALVGPGEKVVITARVTNNGNTEVTNTVLLYVNGGQEDSREITTRPGDSALVSFEVSRDYDGTYIVAVGPESGKFTIQSPRKTDITGEVAGTDIADTGLGIGAVIAIIVASIIAIALVISVLYSRRRD